MSLPILIHLHVYFFTFEMSDLTASPSKVLIPGTRPSISSKKRIKRKMKIVAHEDQEIGSHQEETEIVDLGTGNGKKEVKIGTGMTAPICEELTALLKDYQDIFAWSYKDMPGLSFDIVQHRLPLNPKCSPVKQKLRRMKPKTSLKIIRRGIETI